MNYSMVRAKKAGFKPAPFENIFCALFIPIALSASKGAVK